MFNRLPRVSDERSDEAQNVENNELYETDALYHRAV
jgi:hypothetical protein